MGGGMPIMGKVVRSSALALLGAWLFLCVLVPRAYAGLGAWSIAVAVVAQPAAGAETPGAPVEAGGQPAEAPTSPAETSAEQEGSGGTPGEGSVPQQQAEEAPSPASGPAAVEEQAPASPGAEMAAPLVASVRVSGNKSIAAEAILDEVKGVLAPGMPFTGDRVRRAEALVRRMGYFDRVRISYTLGEQGADVVINVVERQRIERITFVGNTVLSSEELMSAILTRVGHLVDPDAIAKDMQRIQAAYSAKGYMCELAPADVDPYGVLTFVIIERRVEGYEIEGLKRTKRWVVEKQLRVRPGELYSDQLVREQVLRLRNLGLFEEVRFEPRVGKVNPENVILVFQCKEARTGQVAFQVGYSSLDEFVLVLAVAENNFRGRAERISLGVEMFGRKSYEFRFLEPYFRKGDTSIELALFDTERNRRFAGGTLVSLPSDQFEERRRGGYIRASRPFGEKRTVSVTFRSEEVSSAFFQGTRILVPPVLVSSASPSQQGGDWRERPPTYGGPGPGGEDYPGPGDRPGPIVVAAPLHPGGRLASLVFSLSEDFRDNAANPTRGSFRRLSLETAGSFLGGGENFRKVTAEYRYFRPVGKSVLAGRLMLGTSFGNVPLFETFFVGGATTLRGYEEERWRGEKFVLINLEYRRPITKNLTAVVFADAGDAFGGEYPTLVPGFSISAEDQSLKWHVGAGVGIRVVTEIGPLGFDVGFGSEGSRAHLNFGHTF
ncbi:MAG: BamA/TamA family outer membrane protein [Armatimonadetes bacterium]|nr:BamA/TamA family outer membrane protein [Armatimonadota bacterium]